MNVTFQPTSPVRETTRPLHGLRKRDMDFNPRPPCGRRHNSGADGVVRKGFQPTSPVRETTALEDVMVPKAPLFQPTSPVRETTEYSGDGWIECNYFNPRPPCGRRLVLSNELITTHVISTHVPRAGDDAFGTASAQTAPVFQPTSPVRETTFPTNCCGQFSG